MSRAEIDAKDLVRVGHNGRVTLKKYLRDKRGIKEGDLVWIDVAKAEITLEFFSKERLKRGKDEN